MRRPSAGRRSAAQTLGQVVEDALRPELSRPIMAVSPAVPVLRGGDGLRPGVDATSHRALREALDAGTGLADLR